jgi:hypothetical protein
MRRGSNMSKDGVYVCADIGVNWVGDRNLMEIFIGQLARAGVDAVKLQFFDRCVLEQQYSGELKAKLEPLCLSAHDIASLTSLAHREKVEMVVTPFHKELIGELYGIPIDGIKIRAKDAFRHDMTYQANKFADTFKVPYYLSIPVRDGQIRAPIKDPEKGPTEEEKKEGLWMADRRISAHPPEGYLVYCIPDYPPKLESLQLEYLTNWHGFSSHSPEPAVPLMAAAINIYNQQRMRGRRSRFYLEVHVRPDSAMDTQRFLDWNVSLSVSQIKQLCHDIGVMEEAV